jgi:hypothetical protein
MDNTANCRNRKTKAITGREDEARKIFSSRSLKEQLEDTAQRLARLLTDPEK